MSVFLPLMVAESKIKNHTPVAQEIEEVPMNNLETKDYEPLINKIKKDSLKTK